MKSKTNNKGFGLLFFLVFILIGLWPLKSGQNLNIYFIIISLPFLILGIFNSKILTPFNKAWIKFGVLLGRLMIPIVMALVYFFILTPISLIVRIVGKDLLQIKLSKDKSYWIKRKKDLGSMNKQF